MALKTVLAGFTAQASTMGCSEESYLSVICLKAVGDGDLTALNAIITASSGGDATLLNAVKDGIVALRVLIDAIP